MGSQQVGPEVSVFAAELVLRQVMSHPSWAEEEAMWEALALIEEREEAAKLQQGQAAGVAAPHWVSASSTTAGSTLPLATTSSIS